MEETFKLDKWNQFFAGYKTVHEADGKIKIYQDRIDNFFAKAETAQQ